MLVQCYLYYNIIKAQFYGVFEFKNYLCYITELAVKSLVCVIIRLFYKWIAALLGDSAKLVC